MSLNIHHNKKMFHIKVVNLNETYVLGYVSFFCTMSHFLGNQ